MVMLKGTPAVWMLLMVSKLKWSRVPWLTAKLLLTPDFPPPLVVMVVLVVDFVIVTETVLIPFVNAPVLIGVIVPVESLRVFEPA